MKLKSNAITGKISISPDMSAFDRLININAGSDMFKTILVKSLLSDESRIDNRFSINPTRIIKVGTSITSNELGNYKTSHLHKCHE